MSNDSAAAPGFREGISDADIERQADSIRAEVKAAQPVVGELESPDVLLEEYADNAAFQPKIGDLAVKYRAIRRSRGDGQCFYRSFLVALGEQFVQAGVQIAGSSSPLQAAYDAWRAYVASSLPALLALGYPDVTVPGFHDAFTEFVDGLGAPGATVESAVLVPLRGDDAGFWVLYYLRLLTALGIRAHEDAYLPFILGLTDCASAAEFCELEVERSDVDADQVQVTALAASCGVRVRVAYMDATPGSACQVITLPEDAGAVAAGACAGALDVNLLYRPGHYDVAYPAS